MKAAWPFGLGVAAAAGLGAGLAQARLTGWDVASIEILTTAVAMVAFLAVCIRRRGIFSPGALVTVALLLYFPVRALALLLGRPRAEQGMNPRVVSQVSSGSGTVEAAALTVLVIGVAFLAGYGLLVAWSRPGAVRGGDRPVLDHRRLGELSLGLMTVGLGALMIQGLSSLTYLREGSIQGGALSQLWQTLSLCFGFGIVIAPRLGPGQRRPIFLALLVAGLVVAAAAGSKDVLVQILVAVALRRSILGARDGSMARRGWLLGVAAVATVVLVGFPALNSYRRSILEGSSTLEAVAAVPSTLRDRTIVLGLPRRERGVLPYVSDAGLFLSNRLHGFDSLLLGVAAPRDPTLLPARTLLTSPLAVVLPGGFVDPGREDIGRRFAQEYWGLPPSDPTRIAVGAFTQGWIAWSWPAVVGLAAVLGGITCAADKLLARRASGPAVLAYTLLLGALAMERDLVFVVTRTGKHLLLAGLVCWVLHRALEGRSAPLTGARKGARPGIAARRGAPGTPA